jgi:hypothetical protein
LRGKHFTSVIWPLVTFREIFISKVSTSSYKGLIDSGFMFLSCPGYKSISGQTNKQTSLDIII